MAAVSPKYVALLQHRLRPSCERYNAVVVVECATALSGPFVGVDPTKRAIAAPAPTQAPHVPAYPQKPPGIFIPRLIPSRTTSYVIGDPSGLDSPRFFIAISIAAGTRP